MVSALSTWPPPLSKQQLDALILYGTTYALSHGLTYLPADATTPSSVPAAAIHAPISLLPSPLPRTLFQRAQDLQSIYNVIYSRIALDHDFLDAVMGAEHGVGAVDEFVGRLWRGWKLLRREGLAQPLQLGLFRSDYLVHVQDGQEEWSLKQVEFNTISSSFGALSQRVAEMHRYLCETTDCYYNTSPALKPENFPPNDTITGLVEGLVAAHTAYGHPAKILFVVQGGERNVFDQRWLEYELLEKHGIHVVRQTFAQLASSALVDHATKILSVHGSEISTVYFRAGYTPDDYPTSVEYEMRFTLERSKAIKCPSIALQLAGGKKVQEVLTQPGVLERFSAGFTEAQILMLRESWMSMWSLDVAAAGGLPDGLERARQNAARLVLKPQREGGGNNVYKKAIQPFLDQLPPEERTAWIAMELIMPPASTQNYLLRSGKPAVCTEVVSELGIFGYSLFDNQTLQQKRVGWLLRTKSKDSNEGGVAAGFSVLDSVVLVDE